MKALYTNGSHKGYDVSGQTTLNRIVEYAQRKIPMKDFLQRNVTVISTALVGAFIVIFLLLVALIGARELQQKTLARVDQTVSDSTDLLGKKNKISPRSQQEIDTLLASNPHIIGGWATKINYEKTENPVIYYFAKNPIVKTAMENYAKVQASGQGNSSAELNADSKQSLRNSEEAKTGLIKCGKLETTNIAKLAPGIGNIVKGVCRATIPPFDEKVNLAIVVVIDIDGDLDNAQIKEVRRTMLQIQIDIYNRDFQGRETWAHP